MQNPLQPWPQTIKININKIYNEICFYEYYFSSEFNKMLSYLNPSKNVINFMQAKTDFTI